MNSFILSYVVSIASLGTATSLEALDLRQNGFPMAGLHRAVSTLALVIEIGLLLIAFFRFPASTAIVVDLVGFLAPALLMWAVPRDIRPGGVLAMFLVGVIAIIIHFMAHAPEITS